MVVKLDAFPTTNVLEMLKKLFEEGLRQKKK